jgi:hypothetical protein
MGQPGRRPAGRGAPRSNAAVPARSHRLVPYRNPARPFAGYFSLSRAREDLYCADGFDGVYEAEDMGGMAACLIDAEVVHAWWD